MNLSQSPEKKDYSSPVVTEFGTLVDLTEGSGTYTSDVISGSYTPI